MQVSEKAKLYYPFQHEPAQKHANLFHPIASTFQITGTSKLSADRQHSLQYFFIKNPAMSNVPQMGPFVQYFYPIWLPNSMPQDEEQYLQTFHYYPSFFHPVLSPTPVQSLPSQPQIIEKAPESAKTIEAQREKNETKGVQENKVVQIENVIVLDDQKQKTQNTDKVLKIKRPVTYETEKSYYMKQKIKGKMKCNFRILRKRSSSATPNSIKSKLRAASAKVFTKDQKDVKKKHKIEKTEAKNSKITKKIKIRPLKQPFEYLAEVPPLICGLGDLNQFILTKMLSLRLRQMSRK